MPAPKGNKYAVGNNGGRPRKFENPEKIYQTGLKYIEDKLSKEEHLTFTGLCIALGVVKETFNDYANGVYDEDNKVFSEPLKDLKQRVENYAESRLFGNNPTGAIFALKNYGWKDKQEIDSNISGNIEVTFADPDLEKWSK